MKYTTLGATGLRVSQVALGTWELCSAWGEVTPERAAAVYRAYELGINFFDTAHAYGFGASEAGLGAALKDIIQHHRDEIVILTKGGVQQTDEGIVRNSDQGLMRAALESSLHVLGTDHVDIFLIHWPDVSIPFDETAEVLQGFVKAGLARHIGVSNFSVDQMNAMGGGKIIEVAQLPYNLLRRQIEADALPYCVRESIAVMGYAALAQGLLTGTIRPGHQFSADDWRCCDDQFKGELMERRLIAIERVNAIAEMRGCTIAQLAVAWVIANPAGVIPIVGAQLPEHVDGTLGALDVELTVAEVTEITKLVADVPQIAREASVPIRNIAA